MRVPKKLTRTLAATGAVALAGCLPAIPRADAATATTFGNVVAPQLAVDARGDRLLVVQQDLDGTAARGQVVARYRPAGTSRWSGPVAVSSQRRTGPQVAVAMGTPGIGVVVWTASGSGGRAVFARTRHPDGHWGPQQRISPWGAGGPVSVTVNRYRDTAVTFLVGSTPWLATRAWADHWRSTSAGRTSLRRTIDLGSSRVSVAPPPTVALQGRRAVLVYATGTDDDTAVRRRSRLLPAGQPVEGTLWSGAGITGFSYAAGGRARPVLAVVRRTPVGPDCASAWGAGVLDVVRWTTAGPQSWTSADAHWPSAPVASTAGDRVQVSWTQGNYTSGCLDYVVTVNSRSLASGGWTDHALAPQLLGPEVRPVLSQSLAADGAGLLGVSIAWHERMSTRVVRLGPDGFAMVRRTVAGAPLTEGRPPASVAIGPVGWSSAAWTGGGAATARPSVTVESYAR